MLGVLDLREAISKAAAQGLDLVEVSPDAEPPVCKMLDMGKYLYESQKKRKEAKKKQRKTQIKEIKLSLNIDSHDLEYRIRNAKRFIESGDKVKFSLRLRGREFTHIDIAREKFDGILEEMKALTKVEQPTKLENGQLVMILGPQ